MLHAIVVGLGMVVVLVILFLLYAVWNSSRHHHRWEMWQQHSYGSNTWQTRTCRTCGYSQRKNM